MADEKLVDMARTPEEKKAAEERWKEGPVTDDYPWGLCINLGKDELAKLGITELPAVGDELFICAVTKVTSVNHSAGSGENEDNMGVTLQIVKMGTMEEDSPADKMGRMAAKLYGKKD
jgi:hypothetical protein